MLVAALLLSKGSAYADGIGDHPPEVPACEPPLTFIDSHTETTVSEITVGAGIHCARTFGQGTVTSSGGSSYRDWDAPPKEGDHCYQEERVPVTFASLDHPYQHYWRATLLAPDNTVFETVTADYILEGAHNFLTDVGDRIGNHWVTVQYEKSGTWATNPDHTGHCSGAWRFHCQRTWRPEGLGSTIHDPCAELIQVQPRPPDCVVNCLPRAQIYDFVGQAIAQTRAGDVRTSPGPDRGLVNLPDCGWIDGASGSSQRQFVFAVAGPPDSTGRSIRYQYVVTVGPLSVQWNYDDPDQPGFQPGDFGQAWLPGGLCTNPHRYRRISDWNPNHRAHITARHTYGAWVNVVWYDGATVRQYEIGELERTFTLWATAEDQFVGQVEGIPTSG